MSCHRFNCDADSELEEEEEEEEEADCLAGACLGTRGGDLRASPKIFNSSGSILCLLGIDEAVPASPAFEFDDSLATCLSAKLLEEEEPLSAPMLGLEEEELLLELEEEEEELLLLELEEEEEEELLLELEE